MQAVSSTIPLALSTAGVSQCGPTGCFLPTVQAHHPDLAIQLLLGSDGCALSRHSSGTAQERSPPPAWPPGMRRARSKRNGCIKIGNTPNLWVFFPLLAFLQHHKERGHLQEGHAQQAKRLRPTCVAPRAGTPCGSTHADPEPPSDGPHCPRDFTRAAQIRTHGFLGYPPKNVCSRETKRKQAIWGALLLTFLAKCVEVSKSPCSRWFQRDRVWAAAATCAASLRTSGSAKPRYVRDNTGGTGAPSWGFHFLDSKAQGFHFGNPCV